ncbi:hypothetical protein ACFVU3_14595 [Streptomyces sp. NPDC058052]|uniref:hypothetical protein n=1 Tax=Streptomyces sp. NPDC058052 TaxID=3346316 RepID=UPI0036F13489
MGTVAEVCGEARAATTGDQDRTSVARAAAHHLSLLRWAAALLPPAEAARAGDELDATALAAAAVPFLPVAVAEKGDGENDALPFEELVVALRGAPTVLDGDALLDAGPVDWEAMTAEHAREPFGSVASRGLIARRDCPDGLTLALLAPWRPEVADRLAARQKARPAKRRPVGMPRGHRWDAPPPPPPPYELPDPVRALLLPRLSGLRTPLLRLVLTPDRADEVVCATTRLDRLLAAVDHGDRGHTQKVLAFWEAAGAALRAALGTDRTAWTAAAERLARHKGSLRDLVDGLGEPTRSRRLPPDLRVLIQAPPELLPALVAGFDDEALAGGAEACAGRRGTRTGHALLAIALARFEAAGVPPRPLFARWARDGLSSWNGEIAAAGWLYGLDGELDVRLDRRALTDAGLRRLIAARLPQRPRAGDLVAELRAHPAPVRAQLTLDGAGAEPTPWAELLQAHHAEPLPYPVLWVLASLPGCPAALLPELSGEGRHHQLSDLASQGPESARVALTRLAESAPVSHHTPAGTARPAIHTVRCARLLDDLTILETARPAAAVLLYGRDLPDDAPDGDAWNRLCGEHLVAASRRFGPGFWQVLADRLPTFDGTLPELLAPAPGDATLSALHASAQGDLQPSEARALRTLLDRYESRVRAAAALQHDDAPAPRTPEIPDRGAASAWRDDEPATLLALARAAATVRPEFTVALPALLASSLDAPDRVAALIPLAALAQRTAARIGDRHGEAVAWATAGLALNGLRRHEEAAAVLERARALIRTTDDLEREARIHHHLGHALRSLRRDRQAAVAFREAVALFGRTGHERERGEAASDLARLTERMASRPTGPAGRAPVAGDSADAG